MLLCHSYLLLFIFEWITGMATSYRRKEKHESRKKGRMLLKIFVYLMIICMLHIFSVDADFLIREDFEFDLFH